MFARTARKIYAVNFARRCRARAILRPDLYAQRLLKQMIWVWRGVLETVLGAIRSVAHPRGRKIKFRKYLKINLR